jgi:hypothetical protein
MSSCLDVINYSLFIEDMNANCLEISTRQIEGESGIYLDPTFPLLDAFAGE